MLEEIPHGRWGFHLFEFIELFSQKIFIKESDRTKKEILKEFLTKKKKILNFRTKQEDAMDK